MNTKRRAAAGSNATAKEQADAQIVKRFLLDYLRLERRYAEPDDVLRLRTGWSNRRITKALRTLDLLTDTGIFRQGWFDLITGGKP